VAAFPHSTLHLFTRDPSVYGRRLAQSGRCIAPKSFVTTLTFTVITRIHLATPGFYVAHLSSRARLMQTPLGETNTLRVTRFSLGAFAAFSSTQRVNATTTLRAVCIKGAIQRWFIGD
jgi:hypothetical protein